MSITFAFPDLPDISTGNYLKACYTILYFDTSKLCWYSFGMEEVGDRKISFLRFTIFFYPPPKILPQKNNDVRNYIWDIMNLLLLILNYVPSLS